MAPVFTKVFHDDSCACARGGGGRDYNDGSAHYYPDNNVGGGAVYPRAADGKSNEAFSGGQADAGTA